MHRAPRPARRRLPVRDNGIPPAEPCALDAIHLATAHAHRHSLTAFSVYDRRLLEAAKSQDLPTISPPNGAVDR